MKRRAGVMLRGRWLSRADIDRMLEELARSYARWRNLKARERFPQTIRPRAWNAPGCRSPRRPHDLVPQTFYQAYVKAR